MNPIGSTLPWPRHAIACYAVGMDSPADILGPGGRIAARLENYETRGEQLAMADAVAAAIQQGHHLVVEAGTGVGKSFAYLVPAILAVGNQTEDEPSRRRLVISTHTISLQEQLIHKDLPLLRSVMPWSFPPCWSRAGETTSAGGGWTTP